MLVWLVCEHGPIGSLPLLDVGRFLSSDRRLVTTSPSSHLLALARREPSSWLHGWWSAASEALPIDPARYGQAELVRASRFEAESATILQAVRALAGAVDRAWERYPPEMVLLWERRRALGSLVARRAMAEQVPVVQMQNGFLAGSVFVDRLATEEQLSIAVQPLDAQQLPGGHAIAWRRPSPIRGPGRAIRGLAAAGLWLDYAEKAAKAIAGRPALIPPSYWQGYLRARLEGRRNGRAADSGSLPDDLRDFVLVALHFPAAIGSLADPWALLELCIRYVPEGIPLVICPHPADHQVGFPAGLEERMRRRPSTWFVRSVPTWLLLDRASLLITLSSSIGLESLVRGVPTLAIRSAVYTRPGLAQELGERAGEVITAAAISPTDFVPDPRTVAAFLARLEAHHLLAGDVRSLNRDQARAVASRIRQLATSPAR